MKYLTEIFARKDRIKKLIIEKKELEKKVEYYIKKYRNEKKQKRYLRDEFIKYRDFAKMIIEGGENQKSIFNRFARLVNAANGSIEADQWQNEKKLLKMEKQLDKINFHEKKYGIEISTIIDKEKIN